MPTSSLLDQISEGVVALSFWCNLLYLLIQFIGESIPVCFPVVESSLEGHNVWCNGSIDLDANGTMLTMGDGIQHNLLTQAIYPTAHYS